MSKNKTVLFETSHFIIRNLQESDLEAFHLYRSNPEVTKYQGFNVFTLKQAAEFLNEHKEKMLLMPGEWIQFGIEKKLSGELVGDCAIHLQPADSRIAETGITISHLHQRKGYAKESMWGLISYLFGEKGIHRIIETVDSANTASVQLLKSLSFRQEAHFIENVYFKGRWGSEYQFAMLQREWKELIIRTAPNYHF